MEELTSTTVSESRVFGRAVQSSTSRALDINDIVDQILVFGSRHDNVVSARVCFRWRDLALRYVWERLPSLVPLFSLIAPMVEIVDDLGQLTGELVRFYSTLLSVLLFNWGLFPLEI